MFWRLVVCLFAALGLNGQNAGMYVGAPLPTFFGVLIFVTPDGGPRECYTTYLNQVPRKRLNLAVGLIFPP